MSEVWWAIHQTRDIDYTRPTGGPISTEVLEAAGAAGVSDTDPARHMCIDDDSEDYSSLIIPLCSLSLKKLERLLRNSTVLSLLDDL